ncbi:hypothetical protein PC129_g23133 [Phytophthora cactorum]|uniref:Uncharacterized protein n=1 Tax=Phytophthora cactorum TaxID=29920 RepID=A0A8T1AA29_9STRA|nr:hypothetical protein Pcac1_g26345 [Phytophthora cactorum]KAG2792877.1 hypothetical protein PC112_g23680 [Phytophthora cactorum]KAG2798775.1 hypothetical protein PC111_g20709 [Phytophthora cactorum]KAG2830603.1 hypothetical protein PC113_g21082 [Phytophthora cactorum]KAG2876780.1 hypothetical protein PC115_g23530 [Phytophthora cactorum]
MQEHEGKLHPVRFVPPLRPADETTSSEVSCVSAHEAGAFPTR